MNAVMPGTHSSQFAPYGVGLAPNDGVDPLPANHPHYASIGINNNRNTNNSNSNSNNNNDANPNGGGGGGIMDNPLPPDDPGGEQLRTGTGSGDMSAGGPGHLRHPSLNSAATPPEYLSVPQQPKPTPLSSQQQQQQQPMPDPSPPPPQMGGGGGGIQVSPSSPAKGYGGTTMDMGGFMGAPSVPDPFSHNGLTASYPWSIGSTDGSFALVTLQQQQQQIQMQAQQEERQQLQALAAASNNNTASGGGSNNGDDVVVGASNSPKADGTNGSIASGEGSNDHINASAIAGAAPPQPSPKVIAAQAAIAQSAAIIRQGRSLYHDKLFHQSSSSVEGVLAASCDVMGFDIAEMWLRTGLKTHQLTNSHLRPTALQDSVREELVDVYYGDKSNERTHRLSPALCKRAKDANDVVWVTAHTQTGAEALRMSINNVRTAVAVPVCHEASNTNVTIIYFSIRRIVLRPAAVEFLIHMSLSAAVASVNALSTDGLIDRPSNEGALGNNHRNKNRRSLSSTSASGPFHGNPYELSKTTDGRRSSSTDLLLGTANRPPTASISYQRVDNKTSITGARLDLQWRQLLNVEYLTDGGNSWIHTAVFDGKPVVVKTLRPECQDTAVAINEIEAEVGVHSRLNHHNICGLIGAGWTSKKVRFIVLERLDGGTLTQMLGYDTRIRDRRRRFWRKKQLPYLDVLRCARSLACAMQYCNESAIPGSMVLHRDLKPDNIGFTLDGQVKLLDFGLARLLENSDPKSDDVYQMSGETGSLRYMAPEVAEGLPYNHKADVYSFGIILWEMNAGKRPFNGLDRDTFYEQIVHGGGRPHLSKKWPSELNKLIADCWNVDVDSRPTFGQIVDRIDDLLTNEKGGKTGGKALQRLSGIIDRHSTWF